MLRATLFVVLATLFLAFPSYQTLHLDPAKAGKTWQAVLEKGADLQWNVLEKYGPSTNAARVNFRLTGPVLSRLLSVGILGLVTVQAVAGIGLLMISVSLGAKLSGSRAIGIIVATGIGATWAGATAFCELRGVFDGIALCLLMGALASRAFVTAAACIFVACWTDERALVAFPLLLVTRFAVEDRIMDLNDPKSWLSGVAGGMLFGVIAHLISRGWYAAWAGIPHRFDGNGLSVLLNQINNGPMGGWTGLEGGWGLVGGALVVAWARGWRAWSLLYAGTIGIVLVVSLAVVDISRTTAFVLPALFAGLRILRCSESEENFRRLILVCAAVSVVWPMYYAGGKSTIWWTYPLPIQVFRLMLGR